MAMHGRQLQFVEALHHPGRLFHPARQRLAIDVEAMAGEDLRLAIQRRPPGVLGRGDPGDERRRGHAALDQARARLGLDHRALAGPARVFGPDRAQDPEHRRNPIDHVVEVFADAVQRARAARTRGRLRLDRHVDPGKMRRQRPDVALALLARFRRGLALAAVVPAVVIRRRRRCGVRVSLAQSQQQLFGDDDGALFRPRAENDRPQLRYRRLQGLDLALAGEHHFDQPIGVAGQVFGAKRHMRKLAENALNRQQNKASQPTLVGLFTTFGTTRDHSDSPSINMASCALVTRIDPSLIAGQAKLPASNHFVAKIIPEPS